jgi:hypothetical protein
MAFHPPEKFRVYVSGLAAGDATNGCFFVKLRHNQEVRVIASDGLGWEHVSVSRSDRCPTWDEMCQIKDLFWDEDDCVVQYHPPKEDWVNNHPNCLHLWRPIGVEVPRPPAILVGIKKMGVIV